MEGHLFLTSGIRDDICPELGHITMESLNEKQKCDKPQRQSW